MRAKHIHKYYRLNEDGALWTCGIDDCSHHMPKHYEYMLLGKATICWKCGHKTHFDDRTFKMEKPICEECDDTILNFDNELTEEQRNLLKRAGILPNYGMPLTNEDNQLTEQEKASARELGFTQEEYIKHVKRT